MSSAPYNTRCVEDARAALGESPVWSPDEQALYWVDTLAPALHRWSPYTGETARWQMPTPIGSIGLRECGGLVIALCDGFYLFNPRTSQLQKLATPETDRTGTRFNDGKVSPEGRFWAGTMDDVELKHPIGSLYRLNFDGSCQRMVDGLIVSNGLAWTADGKIMFHSDSKAQAIWTWSYDPSSGEISNRRVFARPSEAIGRPDGGATDIEGFYWSAGVSAGVVNRWAPDGRLDRQVRLPCAAPTMPCFGGPDLRTLYVTSLRASLSEGARREWPLSGGIFAFEVEVPGVPISMFKG